MLRLDKDLEKTYAILEEIGSGGGGVIYKAYHRRLQKEVVLKKIHSRLTKKNVNVRAEVDILKSLKSEYLPQVLDFFDLDGDIYTVMEYIPGQSLSTYLKAENTVSQQDVIKWLSQLCQAVEQLHRQNTPIIHGDIKPDNIMLTPEGNICLIDFNISGGQDAFETFGYTPGFASPEQVACFEKKKNEYSITSTVKPSDDSNDINDTLQDTVFETVIDDINVGETVTEGNSNAQLEQSNSNVWNIDNIDVRTDIYSLGATIYRLLTGEIPTYPAINIQEKCNELDDTLAYIVMKCLEQKPDNRFENIDELFNAVKNIYKSNKTYKQLFLDRKYQEQFQLLAFLRLQWFQRQVYFV